MKAHENTIRVKRSARYYTLGNLESANRILFVLHGYGQLAKYFIKHFEGVSETVYVVAPEGLSRFYLPENPKRVGASWMTKEDRTREISDQMEFLDQVANTIRKNRDLPLEVLGFSQGAATATRWLLNSKLEFARCILWAGRYAHDIDLEQLSAFSKKKRSIDIAVGDNDEFLSEDMITAATKELDSWKVAHVLHRFQGSHHLDQALLNELLSN